MSTVAGLAVICLAPVLVGIACGWRIGAEGMVIDDATNQPLAGVDAELVVVTFDGGVVLEADTITDAGTFLVVETAFKESPRGAERYEIRFAREGFAPQTLLLGTTVDGALLSNHESETVRLKASP